jgi:hypothetical protein
MARGVHFGAAGFRARTIGGWRQRRYWWRREWRCGGAPYGGGGGYLHGGAQGEVKLGVAEANRKITERIGFTGGVELVRMMVAALLTDGGEIPDCMLLTTPRRGRCALIAGGGWRALY